MTASESLRVRVDPKLARRVRAWARKNDKDVSEVIRLALERLMAESERAKRVEAALEKIREGERLGLYDAPKDDSWKASGGWR